MAIYKNKDIETNINERGAELGNINVNFYTEDNGTASIRIYIKLNGHPVDLNKINLVPRLDLYAADGSIFTNEEVEVIIPEQGLIYYKINDYVIRHAGKMDAKLFLVNDVESMHVANFYFMIKDSGITGAVGKEIHVDILDDKVKKVLIENVETFRADANETAKYLKPTVVDTTLKKFNELSTAKQVDSEVILARAGKDNLNERITIINNGIGVNILDFPRLESEHDDRNRFQRAIDYLASIGGGKLVIPKTSKDYELIAPGDTTIQNPYRVKIETSNIEIEGVGLPTISMKGLTHSYLNSINDSSSSGRDVFTAFSFIGVENCRISGLRFVGEWDGIGEFRYASPRSIGIGFKGAKNCHVENVTGERILGNVVNVTVAQVASEGFYKFSDNFSIVNSHAYKCLENGFNFMGGTKDGKFINNHSLENGSSGFEAATDSLVVSDNISKGNKYSGISISGKDYLIANNVIANNTNNGELGTKKSNGIQLTGGSNGEILNNRISNSEGNELTIYPGVTNIRIKDNTFIHDNTSSVDEVIYISGTAAKKISDFDFSGNRIRNTSTTLKQMIICNHCDNGIFTNNILTSDFGNYSVYVQGTTNNITLDSNILNKEINLSPNGLNLVSRDNLGDNIVNRVELPNEPTTGKWERGDIVDNISKGISVGSPDRWRCIQSGYACNVVWLANTSFQAGVMMTNDGKVYKSTKIGVTGTTPPTHTTGIQTDGTQEWEYVSALAKFEVAGQVGLYQSSSTVPLFKGQLSQSGNKIFIAIGNSSPSDWVQLSNS